MNSAEIRGAVARELQFSAEDGDSWERMACRVIAAYRRALAEAGYVIVPREPSAAMLNAAVIDWGSPVWDSETIRRWKAMVAKAEEELGDETR